MSVYQKSCFYITMSHLFFSFLGAFDFEARLYSIILLSISKSKIELIKGQGGVDIVGDYLFTDSDFINNLSTEQPNLFKKIYNEIKYLCKIATAGSKEARELENVKRAFDKAYKEITKNTTDKGGAKYALSDIKIPTREELENKKPVKVIDISKAKTQGTYKERRNQINDSIEEVISKPYYNSDTQTLIFLTEKSYSHSFSNNLGEIQINAVEHMPEFIENAILTHAEEKTHGNDYANGSYTFFAAAKTDKIQPVKLKVAEIEYKGQDLPKNVKKYFDENPQDFASVYDTVILEVEEIEESPFGSVKDIDQDGLFNNPNELSEISVADLLNLVKGDAGKYIPKQFSLSDSEGRELSTEQSEYFKDSKIRDANGNLKVMYHGSSETFTVFDKKKARSSGTYGNGFYFTNSKSHAATYGDSYEVYLNIINPLQNGTNDITKEQLRKFVEEIAENEDYGIENYGYGATIDSVVDSVYGKSDFGMLMDLNVTCVGNMVETVELFNEVNGTDYDGIVAPTETVAFYSNQIDAVTNKNPTDNPDIYLSLSKEGEQPTQNGRFYGKDMLLDAPIRDDIAEKPTSDLPDDTPIREDIAKPISEDSEEYISFEDFINRESSVWNNVDYNDEATKTKIMKETHKSMVAESRVVIISDEVKNNVAQAYPDLRSTKKKDRTPILKEAMDKLKSNLRTFLNEFKNQSFEFEVSGKVLDAKLYNTGINEVLEKITQDKAEMLYSTKEIFHNARYLYSTPDYDGDPNVYRWNYFYTPVQIGEQIAGVRIAVRDTATPKESQIYNWGIKKDTSLDGVGRGTKDRISNDVSSDASTDIITNNKQIVNKKKTQDEKQRSWVETSTESEAVDGKVLIEDLDQEAITYQPITNKDTLNKANARLDREGYHQPLCSLYTMKKRRKSLILQGLRAFLFLFVILKPHFTVKYRLPLNGFIDFTNIIWYYTNDKM